jgi:hypothetical protein
VWQVVRWLRAQQHKLCLELSGSLASINDPRLATPSIFPIEIYMH